MDTIFDAIRSGDTNKVKTILAKDPASTRN